MWAQAKRILFPAFGHWGLSRRPSACEADVMPLHHVPLGQRFHNVPICKTCRVRLTQSKARSASTQNANCHSNGHRGPTFTTWGRDGLERYFFEQEHLSKTCVEKLPKSSRPAFSKVLPSRAPANRATDRQDTRHTTSSTLKHCVWRRQEDEASESRPRGHLFSAQCTVRCALPAESRNDMWAQATSIPLLAQFCKSSACRQWHQLFVS